MEYKKASDVFPQALLDEIQRYAEGCIVYIPNKSGNRKPWGTRTNIRTEILNRNVNIRIEFKYGFTVLQLSEKYHLSLETIKRIVYSY